MQTVLQGRGSNMEQEILEKAIQKAIDCGWDIFGTENQQIDVFESTYEDREDDDNYYSDAPHDGLFLDIRRNGYFSVNDVIFNHDFAKALWGNNEDDRMTIIGETDWRKWPLPWQYHLQQIVIAEDPIKYLEENM